MGKITARILKKIAEGDLGEPVQNLYWWLAGKKTVVATVLAFVAGAIEVAERSGLCRELNVDCVVIGGSIQHWSTGVAVVLGYLGQVDGALRTPGPGK